MTATTVRTLRAVIFDVDGTLAETERDGHRVAFNNAFRDVGLPYQWTVAQYGALLGTTGGRRRIEQFLKTHNYSPAVAGQLAQQLHALKTDYFAEWVRTGYLQARPGVHALLQQLLAADISVAVATTGSAAWVHPLLDRLFGDIPFATVVTGDDVDNLKPHPEAYQRAVKEVAIEAGDALAVEDSGPGLKAALAAGLPCVVVTSAYTRSDPFPGAAAVVPGYLAVNMFEHDNGVLSAGVTADALVRLHSRIRW